MIASRLCLVAAALSELASPTLSFAFSPGTGGATSIQTSTFCNRSGRSCKTQGCPRQTSSSNLNMFLGQESGILGVGAPEVVTIVLVGYFVLGPSDLYKLTKEIGKFVTNIRTLGQEATSSFEGAMENQLAVGEIRKAQAELTDAFSFRRSINTDDDFDSRSPPSAVETLEKEQEEMRQVAAKNSADEGSTTAPKRVKKKRRRKKKAVPVEVEDLDMSDAEFESMTTSKSSAPTSVISDEEQKKAELEAALDDADDVWEQRMKELDEKEASTPSSSSPPPAAETSRFQAQLSNDWNQQVIDNTDELQPMAKVMEQLALLEEEREAARARIEEEYRRKEEMEFEFYSKKREVLEQAAAQIQAQVYSTPARNDTNSSITNGTKTEAELSKQPSGQEMRGIQS